MEFPFQPKGSVVVHGINGKVLAPAVSRRHYLLCMDRMQSFLKRRRTQIFLTRKALALLGLAILLLSCLQFRQNASFLVRENVQSQIDDSLRSHRDSEPITTRRKDGRLNFFILPLANITSELRKRHENNASDFYESRDINEDVAEMWLHRGLTRLTYEQGQTMNPHEADVFFIPGYLHWRHSLLQERNELILSSHVLGAIVDKTKPHVLLIPTRSSFIAKNIGLAGLVRDLLTNGVNLYSLGFERNSYWQKLDASRIIPIPYVVQPKARGVELATALRRGNRRSNSLFFYANSRKNAMAMSGCNRSVVQPLIGRTDMDVYISRKKMGNLTQDEYNERMQQSEYCLVMCGDTPTSRTLASAMIAGCIPLRVGSWWRGLCEPPFCRARFGFNASEQPHLPFIEQIHWNVFPELNETEFAQDPETALRDFFQEITDAEKDRMRKEMTRVQLSLVYGWGNPATSTEFGDIYTHIWETVVYHLGLK
jgi:Exostosin family